MKWHRGAELSPPKPGDRNILRRSKKEHAPPPKDDPERRIFDRFFQPLCSFFQQWGASREESRDLAQETLLRVFKGLGRFKNESSLKTWILAIARNHWFNSRRRKRLTTVSLDDTGPQSEGARVHRQLEDGELSAEERVLAQERSEDLKTALEALSPRRQQVLRFHLRGRTHGEISRLMQISTGAVKSHLFQARAEVRAYLLSSSDDPVSGAPSPENSKERP